MLTWREHRRVTKALTVQYDRVLYLLDDTDANRALIHRDMSWRHLYLALTSSIPIQDGALSGSCSRPHSIEALPIVGWRCGPIR